MDRYRSEVVGTGRQVVVKAQFPGQEHVGPRANHVGQQLTARATDNGDTLNRPRQVADDLNCRYLQSGFQRLSHLREGARRRQYTEASRLIEINATAGITRPRNRNAIVIGSIPP